MKKKNYLLLLLVVFVLSCFWGIAKNYANGTLLDELTKSNVEAFADASGNNYCQILCKEWPSGICYVETKKSYLYCYEKIPIKMANN